MTRRLALLATALALLALPPAAVGAFVPPGFVGISPQGPIGDSDFELMRQAGVKSVRLPLFWSSVQPHSRFVSTPEFSAFDNAVAAAAEHRIRVFPFLWGSPGWVAPRPLDEPVGSVWQRWAWASFLRDAVARYGSRGSFWEENPELPFLPIRQWEIWNEENIVTFSRRPDPERFARLIRHSGRVLHRADPGAKAIVGGLFGRPLQVPPNVRSGDFLSRLYRARRVKKYFDGVALHPYVADADAMRPQIANLRRIMRVHHDAATPLYVTELGWGSDSGESRWERGLRGQARELNRAMAMLANHRRAWRVGGVWWFSWVDQDGGCQFCDSAGLLTERREAKPAWYRFNSWTGGDPDTVPRATFGD
ncbi:MAG: hypothetical protein FVQ78_02015 [Solirubrobacterales bacterium]|nr:hypothetical protein [Solirubrobacterales bacterium]